MCPVFNFLNKIINTTSKENENTIRDQCLQRPQEPPAEIDVPKFLLDATLITVHLASRKKLIKHQ